MKIKWNMFRDKHIFYTMSDEYWGEVNEIVLTKVNEICNKIIWITLVCYARGKFEMTWNYAIKPFETESIG